MFRQLFHDKSPYTGTVLFLVGGIDGAEGKVKPFTAQSGFQVLGMIKAVPKHTGPIRVLAKCLLHVLVPITLRISCVLERNDPILIQRAEHAIEFVTIRVGRPVSPGFLHLSCGSSNCVLDFVSINFPFLMHFLTYDLNDTVRLFETTSNKGINCR